MVMLLLACNSPEKNNAQDQPHNNASITSCKLQLITGKAPLVAKQPVALQFKPVPQPNTAAIFLETILQNKVHLIITNAGLSYFIHLYTNIDSAGIYTINTTFPAGGDYILIADYKVAGLQRQTDTFHVNIEGEAKDLIEMKNTAMVCNTGGYEVQLLSKKLVPGSTGMLIMKITRDGKPVLPEILQPYLGEQSHMVVINTETKEYLLVNSKSDDLSYWFMLNFPRAGSYRAWVEFKTGNKLHVADFTIKVGSTH